MCTIFTTYMYNVHLHLHVSMYIYAMYIYTVHDMYIPLSSTVGLSRLSVQEYAGVLECRPQQEADVQPGGQNTRDSPGGRPHRGVGTA